MRSIGKVYDIFKGGSCEIKNKFYLNFIVGDELFKHFVFWGCELSETGNYVTELTMPENMDYDGQINDPFHFGYYFDGWAWDEDVDVTEGEIPIGVSLTAVWQAELMAI